MRSTVLINIKDHAYLQLPGPYPLECIYVEVGHPNLARVVEMDSSSMIRLYCYLLVLLHQLLSNVINWLCCRDGQFHHDPALLQSARPNNCCHRLLFVASSWYSMIRDFSRFWCYQLFCEFVDTFQLRMNSMLRVIRDLAKSRSIISVITRSSNTWTCNIMRESWRGADYLKMGLKRRQYSVKGGRVYRKQDRDLHLGIGIHEGAWYLLIERITESVRNRRTSILALGSSTGAW